jgi:hypothetical protein
MGNRSGVVVPFERPASASLRQMVEARADEAPNAAWDDVLHAAMRVWSWRDPESLDALMAAIGHVRPFVDHDWKP